MIRIEHRRRVRRRQRIVGPLAHERPGLGAAYVDPAASTLEVRARAVPRRVVVREEIHIAEAGVCHFGEVQPLPVAGGGLDETDPHHRPERAIGARRELRRYRILYCRVVLGGGERGEVSAEGAAVDLRVGEGEASEEQLVGVAPPHKGGGLLDWGRRRRGIGGRVRARGGRGRMERGGDAWGYRLRGIGGRRCWRVWRR